MLFIMKADKQDWHRGTHQAISPEGPGQINQKYLDITREKRTEELEMW